MVRGMVDRYMVAMVTVVTVMAEVPNGPRGQKGKLLEGEISCIK